VDFDFYSPFVAAAIVTEDGSRFPLWTNAQAQARDRQGTVLGTTESLAYLQDISVELQLGFLPIITATLAPPFHDLWTFLSSPLMNWGVTRLEVQFGYTGGAPSGAVLSPVWSGILLKPDVSIGEDASITLNAQGVGYSMARQQSGRTFNNKTRAEIISEVVKGPRPVGVANASLATVLSLGQPQIRRLSPNFDAVRLERNRAGSSTVASAARVTGKISELIGKEIRGGIGASAYSLMFEETISTSQGFQSDWLFVWNMVRQARCTMLVQGDELRIFPTGLWRSQPPKRTLYLYNYPQGRVGPISKSLPILTVSSPTMAVYLPGSVRGMVQRDVDSRSREPVQGSHNDSTVKPDRTSEDSTQPQNSTEYPGVNELGDGGGYAPGSPLDSEARAQAQAEFEAETSGMGIRLEVTTLLDPEVIPGDVLTVKGISKYHDTNYGVLKAVYSGGLSGSEMSVELVSNVSRLASQVLSQDLTPFGSSNTHTPPEGEALDTKDSGPAQDPELSAAELEAQRRGGVL
jgi:hypothetical protein